MARSSTTLELFNAALTRHGEDGITKTGDSLQAMLYRANADNVAAFYLARHTGSFARKKVKLAYKGTTDTTGEHAYIIPGDFLDEVAVMLSDVPLADVQFRSDVIVTTFKSDDIELEYIYDAPVKFWPQDLVEVVTRHYEGLWLQSLEDYPRARDKFESAEALFLEMMARDAAAAGRAKRTPDPVMVKRWRGGRYRAN